MEIENPPLEKEFKKNNDDAAKEDGNRDDIGDKDEDVNEEDDEPDKLKVSFLCLIFVQDVIITSAEDGFLYVWEGNKIK